MNKVFIITLCAIVVASCQQKDEKIKPTIGTITISVYASVIVQPENLYQVFSGVHGILEETYVTEGQVVENGSPLLQIVNSSPKLNTENARLSYEFAQKNYEGNTSQLLRLKEEISAAKLKLNNDSINFFRQKNLWEQQIGSKSQYDSKKLAYQLASNALQVLEGDYLRTKNELETQLRQATVMYQNAAIVTKDYTIVSKMDGKVYALDKNPGEIINTTQPLASIGSADSFVIEMLVDEADIVKIKKEQKVIVSLDAYPNEVFTALVNKIYPNKDNRNQTFKVEARFEEQPETLYPGLSGEANIITAVKENVMLIPREYLIENNKVRTDSGDVEVDTGLQNMDTVEILAGITEDSYLLKPKG